MESEGQGHRAPATGHKMQRHPEAGNLLEGNCLAIMPPISLLPNFIGRSG